MPVSEFRMFINNEGATDETVSRFTALQIDQAMGMATEAELRMDLTADAAGNWADLESDLAQPMQRVRIEVRVGSGDFVPLIDGPVVTHRFDFNATPDRSTMTLIAQDDSVLLNQEESVELFEDTTPDQIATTLIQAAGLEAQAESVPDAGSSVARYTVRRGTAMALLRDLARRHGMNVYVRPGDEPGKSVVVFERPRLAAGDLPELLVMGATRNVNRIELEFDALRPASAIASGVRISDKAVLTSEADASDLAVLGDTPVHELLAPARVLLARTREETTDLDAATQAAVNTSSWAFTARGETAADIYAGVLQAYGLVRLAGVGATFAGDYLISRVTHVLDSERYQQRFTLVRNARMSSGGAPSVPGVF
ncbi:MAG: phage late control D family protein [Burkholderiales bacterium]